MAFRYILNFSGRLNTAFNKRRYLPKLVKFMLEKLAMGTYAILLQRNNKKLKNVVQTFLTNLWLQSFVMQPFFVLLYSKFN